MASAPSFGHVFPEMNHNELVGWRVLRRMMEDFSEVTRFCILCNYVSRIIDPITSRCAKFRFKPLTDEVLYERIRFIAEREGIRVSDQCCRRTGGRSRFRVSVG